MAPKKESAGAKAGASASSQDTQDAIHALRREARHHNRESKELLDEADKCIEAREEATTAPSKESLARTERKYDDAREQIGKYADALDELEELGVDVSADRTAYDGMRVNAKKLTLRLQKLIDQAGKAAEEAAAAAASAALAAASSTPATGSGASTSRSNLRISSDLKPEALEVDTDFDHYVTWEKKFRDYYVTNNMSELKLEAQQAYLRVCLSSDMIRTVEEYLKLPASSTIEDTLKALEVFHARTSSIVKRRHEWYSFKQKPGESMRALYVRLMRTAQLADLGKMTYDDHLASKLIISINDEELSRELLEMKEPKLDDIKLKCETWESSRSTARQLVKANKVGSTSATVHVAKTSTYKREKQAGLQKKAAAKAKPSSVPAAQPVGKGTRSNQPKSNDRPKCKACGMVHRNKADVCPAANAPCLGCGKTGHFKKVCPRAAATVANGGGLSTVWAVTAKKVGHCDKVKTTFSSGEAELNCRAQPDTGASICLLPTKMAREADFKLNQHDKMEVQVANQSWMECTGSFPARITANGQDCDTTVYVSDEAPCPILSRETVKALRMIPAGFPFAVVDDGNVMSVDDQDSCASCYVVQAATEDATRLRAALLEEYADVFAMTPGEEEVKTPKMPKPMKGEPMEIYLREEAKPVAIHVPRKVPFALEELVKTELDEMVAKGLLVQVDEPTKWCSGLVTVLKPSGDPRITVDYKPINQYVLRPTHPFPAASAAVRAVPPQSTWFASMDATKGYWQIALSKDASLLTTFITPWGRYRYTRAPMGLSSSGDEFCRRGDRALAGLRDIVKVVDDILLHARSLEELEASARRVLDRCRKYRISMSPEKFVFGVRKIDFVGHTLSGDGVTVNASKLKAISEFPVPKDLTDLRSFMGLANQLGGFHPRLTEVLTPLRPLLSTKRAVFVWDEVHQQAFEEARRVLSSVPVLAQFDPTKPVKLVTDASKLKGLGYALLQPHGDHDRLVTCNSRSLTSAESNYAVIELELLALVWACQQSKLYLLGLESFTAITDHKPLKGVINKRLEDVENPRLLRLLEKLRPFNLELEWVAGKTHLIADALSRSPVSTPCEKCVDDDDGGMTVAMVATNGVKVGAASSVRKEHAVAHSLKAIPADVDLFVSEVAGDKVYCKLRACLQADEAVPGDYAHVADRLSVDRASGLILLDASRIVVPVGARPQVLRALHAGHQGSTRAYEHARGMLYWPRMRADIEHTAENCDACQLHHPSARREPRQADPVETAPMQSMSADLFEYSGRQYLVVIDRYTSFPFVSTFARAPTARQVKAAMLEIFALFGLPGKIRTDGGPQFAAAEFKDFCAELRIEHAISSAYYPESNGHAEVAVRVIKNMVKRGTSWDQIQLGLMELRATPLADGISPAQWMLKRGTRTTLPGSPEPTYDQAARVAAFQRRLRGREKETNRSNASARTIKRKAKPGDHVRIQDRQSKLWDSEGVVIELRSRGRSAVVQAGSRTFLRNRRFLKPFVITDGADGGADDSRCGGAGGNVAEDDPTAAGGRQQKRGGRHAGAGPPAGSEQPRRSSRAKKKPDRLGT